MKKLLLLFLFSTVLTVNAQTVALTGGFIGWPENPTTTLFTTTDNINYTLLNLVISSNSAAKFTNGSWPTACGCNGSCFPNGTGIVNGGQDIQVPAGNYNVYFNNNTKVYSFVSNLPIIKLTGSAFASDYTLGTTDGTSYSGKSITALAGSGRYIEVGTSNSWGSAAFPSGTATQGGPSMNVAQGTYSVMFNRSTGAYGFDFTSLGVIGSFPSSTWGGGPDLAMTTSDGVIYTVNLSLTAAATLKFRDNSTWNENQFSFSSGFPSGTALKGNGVGSDFNVPIGDYTITFNRSTYEYNFGTLATESFSKNFFVVSPNPSNTSWNFSSENKIDKITVFDVLGKSIATYNVDSDKIAIDNVLLNTGIYFAKVNAGELTQTIKLIKN